MHWIDLAILLVYVGFVLAIGFWVKRRASTGVESYFLGGRTLPWWMIAMSGSSSYFDITGTMWIVSIFVAYGFNGFWIQWVWGFLIAAFYLAFMGKWIRRSRVVTGAEWMVYRFGQNAGGDAARLAYTMFAVLTLTTFIGYTAVGMGKFGSQFLPLAQWLPSLSDHQRDAVCSTAIIGITGAYVVVGGFTSLTIVEFVQTLVLTTGAIIIACLGFKAYDAGVVAQALEHLANGDKRMVAVAPRNWYSIVPPWRIEDVHNAFYLFGAVVLTYLYKGLMLGASGPEQLYDFQKFLATRDSREASKAGLLWGICHSVRFPMAMAITIMGVMAFGLESREGFDNEKVLPYVIAHKLPAVFKGIALAALISAFMATFGAMVNGSASYLIRDVYQRYLVPRATPSHYVKASYAASILMILVGITISVRSHSIDAMLRWILGFLGSAVLVPNVLRWYWWRLTGYGFAAGIWTALILSLAHSIFDVKLAACLGLATVPDYVVIPALSGTSALACIVVTLLTQPPTINTLANFYRTTQPTGFWGPVARYVAQQDSTFHKERFTLDLVNLLVGLVWLGALYVGPSYAVAHRWKEAGICGAIVGLGAILLAVVWYPRLPKAHRDTASG